MYMPHEKSFDAFFTAGWTSLYFVFDEDDDDHRWERVEMYYPMHGFGGPKEIDLYSTKRWLHSNFAGEDMVAAIAVNGTKTTRVAASSTLACLIENCTWPAPNGEPGLLIRTASFMAA